MKSSYSSEHSLKANGAILVKPKALIYNDHAMI